MPPALSPDALMTVVRLQNALVESGLALEQVMTSVTRAAKEITGADASVIELVEGDEMVYRAAEGLAAGHEGLRLKVQASLSGRSVLEQRVLRSDDTEADDRVDTRVTRRVGARSMLCVPLMHARGAVGVLNVYAGAPYAFDDGHVAILELLSGTIAAHMANAERFERAVHDAGHDALTGLPNRRSYDDRLEREARRAERYGAGLSLVLFDLDGFKAVNDRFGHDAGDAALRDFAAVLAGVRSGDECFRVGGDEFAVLLPETDADGARTVAERVAAATGAAAVGHGRVTASYGIAEFAAGPGSDLHRAADLALGATKRARREAPRVLSGSK